MPLIFMCFPAPYTRAASHTQAAPSMSTILTHPRGFPRVLAPFSHTFPRLPHTVTKLQKPRHWFRQDQRSGPANPQPAGPTNPQNLRIQSPQISNQPARKFPNPRLHLHGHGSLIRKPTRRDQRTVHSNAHPANLLKFPAPTRGAWVWRQRRRCGVAATLTTRGRGCVVVRRRAGMVLGPNLASRYVEFWPGYGRWQTNDPAFSCGKP